MRGRERYKGQLEMRASTDPQKIILSNSYIPDFDLLHFSITEFPSAKLRVFTILCQIKYPNAKHQQMVNYMQILDSMLYTPNDS